MNGIHCGYDILMMVKISKFFLSVLMKIVFFFCSIIDISWQLSQVAHLAWPYSSYPTMKKISTIYHKQNLHPFWLVLTFDLLEDRHIYEITTDSIFLFWHMKQIHSMNICQKKILKCGKTLMTHLATPHVSILSLHSQIIPESDPLLDLMVYY